MIYLGYNDTYHGYEAAVENPRDCRIWMEAFQAKYDGIGTIFGREEFDRVLGHCQAVCDGPATCFTPELLAAYPDAKVVLSNRDVDEWYNSVMNAIIGNIFNPKATLLSYVTWIMRSPSRWTRPLFIRVFSDPYGGNFAKNGKQVFKEHYAMVRRLVPAENLLEYKVQDGWDPLCTFLGHEPPKMPFPNGNNKAELDRRISKLVVREMLRLLKLCTLLVLILLSIWGLVQTIRV